MEAANRTKAPRVLLRSKGPGRFLLMYYVHPETKQEISKSAGTADWDKARELAEQWQAELAGTELPTPRKKARLCDKIYVLEAEGTGRVKIGMAVDVNLRIKALQPYCPVPLRLLCVADRQAMTESEIHRKFSAYRKHGEWFDYSDEIRQWVLSIA